MLLHRIKIQLWYILYNNTMVVFEKSYTIWPNIDKRKLLIINIKKFRVHQKCSPKAQGLSGVTCQVSLSTFCITGINTHSICFHDCGLWVTSVCDSSTYPAIHSLVNIHPPTVDWSMSIYPWDNMLNNLHTNVLQRERERIFQSICSLATAQNQNL